MPPATLIQSTSRSAMVPVPDVASTRNVSPGPGACGRAARTVGTVDGVVRAHVVRDHGVTRGARDEAFVVDARRGVAEDRVGDDPAPGYLHVVDPMVPGEAAGAVAARRVDAGGQPCCR